MNVNLDTESFENRNDAPAAGPDDSVDDFIRELEEKEKDLHITPDLNIEIEDVGFEDADIPEFIREELSKPKPDQKNPMTPKQAPAETDTRLKEEIASLKNQVSELRRERTQILEKSQLRLKEFENFKRRLERERKETFVDQVCNLAKMMLPVLDNLDRALTTASQFSTDNDPEFQQFHEGIFLVNDQIKDILERMGLQAIPSIGEQFDPEFHEAVEMVTSTELPPKTIIEELLPGYQIGEKIIRHSIVKVVGETANDAKPMRIRAADPAPQAQSEIDESEDIPLEEDLEEPGCDAPND